MAVGYPSCAWAPPGTLAHDIYVFQAAVADIEESMNAATERFARRMECLTYGHRPGAAMICRNCGKEMVPTQ